ncbi:reverse transcriptase [Gossypium australe]|uniref:Reverse transcriptase n=1 Tax=Gossypium australe TaxID=47621 RepID=A0A5B6W8Q6_9ROSI|nr:reverse transcriptase [Gossypium australe]
MGFASSCVDFIIHCISSVSYSICLNGEMGGRIKQKRGLRQGDPLGPCLYFPSYEIIYSRMINKWGKGKLQMASYFSFIRERGTYIKEYAKYEIFSSSNASEQMRELVSSILNVRIPRDLERYLGLHNMVGKNKRRAFQILKD